MIATDAALLALGRALRARGYRFTTVTPETHRRVVGRPYDVAAPSLADVFGWSRPFRPGALPPELEDLLARADAIEPVGELRKSRVRYSTLGEDLFVHSAWPTDATDAVFFGPDTYRFVQLVRRSLPPSTDRLVDVGCGGGAGGLAVRDRVRRLVLADLSEVALRYAAIDAALAETQAECVQSDVLAGVEGPVNAVIANPPYLVDAEKRLYRDGGDRGTALAVRIVRESLSRILPGGVLILYTGSPVVDGRVLLVDELAPLLADRDARWEDLDPDVFGDELDRPAYSDVERIALLGLVVSVAG